MATTTIESPEKRLERIERLCAENSEAMGLPRSTPPARPRSTVFPWAAVALGAVIGAAVVAIAGWGLG